ncbi:hypothetical protein Acr_11g0008960 [Actinidia rufa]|uniref:Uncharacterized protein n=1 Tax=Actinidia rufa TaxID=165716 RepID=A0A7J0FD12_9ERIC|nr:hypothetical protein Acr_11g0008960 [Actinidia rufa]
MKQPQDIVRRIQLQDRDRAGILGPLLFIPLLCYFDVVMNSAIAAVSILDLLVWILVCRFLLKLGDVLMLLLCRAVIPVAAFLFSGRISVGPGYCSCCSYAAILAGVVFAD